MNIDLETLKQLVQKDLEQKLSQFSGEFYCSTLKQKINSILLDYCCPFDLTVKPSSDYNTLIVTFIPNLNSPKQDVPK